jgi:DNA mismatch repair ATPase MutL
MASGIPRVQRLPEETVSRIRTGVTVPNITQIVEELVVNTIDGLASHITVSLDFDNMSVSVEDNVSPPPPPHLFLAACE